jgi:predicted RNA-binding Zn-ribbon protein involved in translation (DUF1610 family)
LSFLAAALALAPDDGRMKLVLEAMTATCPECGHADFRPPSLRDLARRALTCNKCGVRVSYGALLQQMGNAPNEAGENDR